MDLSIVIPLFNESDSIFELNKKINEIISNSNIDVEIISPKTDNYKYSPAKKIELYLADIALCPTESIISFRTKKKPFKLYALATIFQRDISAIAVVKSNNIKSPKDLDGRSYASYGARYGT